MANDHLKKFKTLVSGADPFYRPAPRYQFFIQFEFEGGNKTFDLTSEEFNNIGYLVRDIDLPNFVFKEENQLVIQNPKGSYRVPGEATYLPDDNTVNINFLDTEKPIFEGFFLPWLKSITGNKGYSEGITNKVFPRANIHVYIYDNSNKLSLHYVIIGAYPNFIASPKLSHSDVGIPTRSIGFGFNEIDAEDPNYNTGDQDDLRGNNQGRTEEELAEFRRNLGIHENALGEFGSGYDPTEVFGAERYNLQEKTPDISSGFGEIADNGFGVGADSRDINAWQQEYINQVKDQENNRNDQKITNNVNDQYREILDSLGTVKI